jgi:hypothetical protein
MMLPRKSMNAYVHLLQHSQIVQLNVESNQVSIKFTTPLHTHVLVLVNQDTNVMTDKAIVGGSCSFDFKLKDLFNQTLIYST